jgi:zinc protease
MQFLGVVSYAQNQTTIKLNPEVRYGKLSNGLTYYILHNEEPKQRVSFYFAQNVGAILEEDSQNGLAHFLEHMAFNGLEHFKGKEMITYLEKNRIKFGRDINAFTAHDETVYNISNIPVTREGLMDSCLLVLHDWSGGLLLEESEIDAERGVIREEWRTRRNVRKRLSDQTNPYMFNHSKYAVRDVIGSLDVINNFKYDELRAYYKKWYRPDQQAVVIVGDVDVDNMEKKVKTLFSRIKMPANAAERKYFEIEDTKALNYVAATDPEAQTTSMAWIFRLPAKKLKDEKWYRNDLAEQIFNSIMNQRLREITRKPECPALGMQMATFNLVRTKAAAYWAITPKDGKELDAFKVFAKEFERAARFGVTESELERSKLNVLRSYDSYLKNKEKISNEDWAQNLYAHFLKAEPVPAVEWEVEFANKIIPQLTVEEVNMAIKNYMNFDNSTITISGSDTKKANFPTKEQLVGVLANMKNEKINPYKEEVDNKPLIDKKLEAVKIAESSELEGIAAKKYVLENGATVVVYPTDYEKDNISMSAYSWGGTSILPASDIPSANLATGIASLSGLGNYNADQLRKKLAGKIASVNVSIGGLSENVSGAASPDDFETLMQLTYLKFVSPRFDKAAFEAQMAGMRNSLINSEKNNKKAFKDTVTLVSSNYSERAWLFNKKFVDAISFDKAKKIYLDRISDASDFTFVFVGNIDEAKHLPMIQKYIGNIPSSNRVETYVNNNIKPADGHTFRNVVREMPTPKSTVYFNYSKAVKYDRKSARLAYILADLLGKRYHESIREEEGGTYGVGVQGSISRRPSGEASFTISFDCDPAKQEKLRQIVRDEIAKLIKKGPVVEDLEKIKGNLIKSREEVEEKNGFWMNVITANLKNGSKYTNLEDYKKEIESINPKMIKKFAKKIFKDMDVVEVIMTPKK